MANAIFTNPPSPLSSVTRSGLLFLIAGAVLRCIPYIGVLGLIASLIGVMQIIRGRAVFGRSHSKLTTWAVAIYVTAGILETLAITGLGALFFSLFKFDSLDLINAAPTGFLALTVAACVFALIAEVGSVLFTYGLQAHEGRVLLWLGYLANLLCFGFASTVTSSLIVIVYAMNSAQGTAMSPESLGALSKTAMITGLMGLIPAAFYAFAYFLAWQRIKNGEIPVGPVGADDPVLHAAHAAC